MVTQPRQIKRRQTQATPLSSLVDGIVEPALRRRGFAAGDIIRHWPDIVGERIAACSCPERLKWPRAAGGENRDAGTLSIRVDGPIALEIQHQTPRILERLNSYYGYRAVSRLKIMQGPLPQPTKKPPKPPCPPEAEATVQETVSCVEDGALREALTRLGRSIASDRTQFRQKQAQNRTPLNKS